MADQPWVAVAKSLVGVKELPGTLHNPTIVGWLKRFALNIGAAFRAKDETPWCAAFVSHCLEASGFPSTRDARAMSYARYGKQVGPHRGAIVVIRRRRKEGEDVRTGSFTGNHVLILDTLSRHYIKGWGGNQRNSVSLASFSRGHYDIIAMRWPEAAPVPALQPTHL